ncbi:enoyl-CoA hydratase [Sphingobium sp. C100]|jgi:2-(1,2-epoxy-1,2-dihydrophenyl)acetyl-CoA isomerase|uniref:enoyl-CoA hydratase/isomerase family protein n=1 Tax=Sphingobium sp. C100 TaxID=1207055 RepID=UPI0003D5BAAC|nr:enoyl-CoA hydratase-related protein [Sphingobium sp. C100]ETI63695.1 enoyl-CoA hydratase [Sphingobium sp. C100]
MAYENILYDVSDRIATVTLNRPDAMNATTDELYQELQQLLGEIAADTSVGCVILTGAGKGFCAGADLKARRDHMTPIQLRARHRWILKDILEPLFRLEKPVIAAVNGAAAGAGFNIALACDFIIASEQASFIQAFAKVGLVPDLGGMYLLGRVIGINKAKELCFTARKVLADEAKALGIVNHVVPHDQLMGEARATAARIVAGSPTALAMTKTLLNKASNSTLDQMLEYESYAQTVAYLTPEYKEGVQAFREKRAPDFAAAAARG